MNNFRKISISLILATMLMSSPLSMAYATMDDEFQSSALPVAFKVEKGDPNKAFSLRFSVSHDHKKFVELDAAQTLDTIERVLNNYRKALGDRAHPIKLERQGNHIFWSLTTNNLPSLMTAEAVQPMLDTIVAINQFSLPEHQEESQVE
jgi:hypothetical protein